MHLHSFLNLLLFMISILNAFTPSLPSVKQSVIFSKAQQFPSKVRVSCYGKNLRLDCTRTVDEFALRTTAERRKIHMLKYLWQTQIYLFLDTYNHKHSLSYKLSLTYSQNTQTLFHYNIQQLEKAWRVVCINVNW